MTPDDQLARVILVGSPATMRDLSVVSDIPDGPRAHVASQGAATEPIGTNFHSVDEFQVFILRPGAWFALSTPGGGGRVRR